MAPMSDRENLLCRTSRKLIEIGKRAGDSEETSVSARSTPGRIEHPRNVHAPDEAHRVFVEYDEIREAVRQLTKKHGLASRH